MRDWRAAKISPEDSLLKAMAVINQTTYGIALVVDEQEHLLGAVVDGDIRRAALKSMSLDTPVQKVMKRSPVTAPPGRAAELYLDLMLSQNIQQLPLTGDDGKVVGIVFLKDLHAELVGSLKAVIMAGGLGTRLRPLTEETPKPMLPVGDKPILEHVLQQLRGSGIREVVVSTHYKAEMIRDYLGDGSSSGLAIKYVNEEHRFGTIGALRLMREELTEPFLVINGDILTTLEFSSMHMFHRRQHADMTVAVRKHDLQVPYGVVQLDGESVVALEEKPTRSLLINAGIYLINPTIIEYIPEDRPFDATDLIAKLIEHQRPVAAFPVIEYWMDVGCLSDYQRVQEDITEGRL